MLKIDNLNIITNKGRVLVKDFSFALNNNDKIALIGEEGNGKSTILKVIAGIDISNYAEYSGSIICNDKIGYLPQTIDDSDLDLDVVDYITSGEHDYSTLYEVIKYLNIDNTLLEDRIIKSLSGGEKVKIALAKVLYDKPGILLLDEPTNNLDLKTLIWLESFIYNSNLPIIFISHDETLLENCSNGILHLEQLKRKTETKLTYSGEGYLDYQKRRNYNIDRINMIARKEKAEYNKQLEKYRKIYQSVDNAINSVSRQDPHAAQMLKKKMHTVKATGRRLEEKEKNLTQKFEPEEAIDVYFDDVKLNPHKVVLDYKLDELKIDNKVLANNIELHVEAKDKICIIGDNGCGKSTLMHLIYKQLNEESDLNIGYMPQNYFEIMDYNLTPIDYLLNNGDRDLRIKITNYLGSLKFTSEEMSHKISELSEGQKCKVLLIKQIIDKKEVLLLDEPTRNLSPLSNPIVRKILSDYKGCIIAISHDRKFIDEVFDDVYELTNTLKKLQ